MSLSSLVSIPDIYMNLVKNVNTFSDLVKLCNTSSQTRVYCSKYQSEYFFNLIQKDSFLTSYYNKFRQILNSQNEQDFQRILNYYPIGKFYGKNFNNINKLQVLISKIGISIRKFINLDTTIVKNAIIVSERLDNAWKNLILCIFFPSNFLINQDQMSRLSKLSQFDLVFYRERHLPFGFWDLNNLLEIGEVFKIILTGKINIQSIFNLTIETQINDEYDQEDFNLNFNINKNFNTNPFQQFLLEQDNFNNFLTFYLFHLNIYNKSNHDIFKKIMQVLVKQIVYSCFVDDDDIMYDFLPYARWSLDLLYSLEQQFPQGGETLVKDVVINCFMELGGLNLQNYSEIEDNPNFIYFKEIHDHFFGSSRHFHSFRSQSGGREVRSKLKSPARSECKRNKISQVMKEFKTKTLKTRWGKRVINPKQAIAIGLSMADKYCN